MRVWMCDRCQAMNNGGDEDDPPVDWEVRSMPVRGSEGARSSRTVTLCTPCDDALYDWLSNA